MIKKTYEGSSVKHCIELACDDLKLNENELKYTIIEEIKGFFKKKAVIEVTVEEKEKVSLDKEELEADGSVVIENGEIIVTDPKEGGKAAILSPSVNAKLFIDEDEVNLKTEVFSKNKIEVVLEETPEPQRQLNITTSANKMEAYISIRYIPQIIYKLKDVQKSKSVVLEVEQKSQQYPPVYTINELKEQLSINGVKYGIIEENLNKALNTEGVNSLLIAKGDETVNDEDDALEILFKVENKREFSEDEKGTVDFKSIGFVKSVNKGAVIAVKHAGKTGNDGRDVTGKVTKHKTGKKINLKIGEGCTLKDDKVIAARQGEPSYIGQKFCIFELHEVQSDVDISTGNIKFDGDVIVHGEVKEGMEVEAGNNVKILKSVENAKIKAKGNVVIQQNVIFSSVLAGGEDVEKMRLTEYYTSLYNNLNDLFEGVKQVKEYNLLGDKVSNGEIIKALLESRFKSVTKTSMSIILSHEAGDEIKKVIGEKLIGLGPLSMKFADELTEIASLINNEITMLKRTLSIPVDVTIGYSQNSTIQSSGNVIITGKGEYVSNIIANEKVTFVSPASIARGGLIKAKNEIRCGVVGSVAAVPTKLSVDKGGHIYAAVAYANTSFCINNNEFIIDTASKDIHAYLNENSEIVVDKFIL